jgi:hypothetical protein
MKMCHPAIIDQDFSPTSTTSCQQQPKQKKNVLTELLMVLNRTAIVIINIEDQSPTPAMLAILTSFQTRHVVRLLHPDNPSEEREREREREVEMTSPQQLQGERHRKWVTITEPSPQISPVK